MRRKREKGGPGRNRYYAMTVCRDGERSVCEQAIILFRGTTSWKRFYTV